MDKLKSIYASAYSAAITIVVVTALTIGAEVSPSLKNWLTNLSGHHWITKSFISLIVFVLLYVFLFFTRASVSDRQTRKALVVLQVLTVLGFIVVLGFYLYEFFAH